MSLRDIQNLILRGEYIASRKLLELIRENEFSFDDLCCCIETARKIAKKERDELGESVDGYKYTIIGRDTRGLPFYTTGKMMRDLSGRYYFFITAHEAD